MRLSSWVNRDELRGDERCSDELRGEAMNAVKPEILVITPIYGPTLAELKREYVVHELYNATDKGTLLRDAGPRVRAMVTTGFVGFKRSDLDPLANVEIVACYGNGHNTYDLAAAKERGIVVTNTPDPTSETVAELAVTLLLTVSRRVAESDRYTRAGRWTGGPGSFGLGHTVMGKTCGVIGLGNIGRGVARRCAALGMSVIYHGPRAKSDVPYRYYASALDMARDADALIVTCPLTPQTRGLVDARALEALGANGYLVNVGRGPIVDQQALIAVLRDKRIGGAALDVYWNEPEVPAELKSMDNVVLVPHIGSSTVEIREERGAKLLANLAAHFAGEPVLNPVTL
jgi:lactate dehydrogenase-like 2-hydroxyacid dehydrogenase